MSRAAVKSARFGVLGSRFLLFPFFLKQRSFSSNLFQVFACVMVIYSWKEYMLIAYLLLLALSMFLPLRSYTLTFTFNVFYKFSHTVGIIRTCKFSFSWMPSFLLTHPLWYIKNCWIIIILLIH